MHLEKISVIYSVEYPVTFIYLSLAVSLSLSLSLSLTNFIPQKYEQKKT